MTEKKRQLLRLSLFLAVIALTACNKEKETYIPKDFDDFKGHTVCVLEGSIQQDYVMSHMNDGSTKFVTFVSSTDCMVAMNQGKADVFFGAELYAYNEAFHRQHLKISALLDAIDAPVAMGFKKGNNTLTDDYNAFQDSLTESGELKRIVERWFSPDNTDFHNCIVLPPTDGKASSNGGKVLRVGISGVKPPAEVMIDNKWTGCEIEFLQRYAASRGLQLNIETFDFSNLIPALQTEKIDIAAATMAINEERKAKINFANKYTNLKTALIIPDPEYAATKSFWQELKESTYHSLLVENRWKLLLDGFWITLLISISSLLLGSIWGGIVCWMVMNKRRWLRVIGKSYIHLVRNIPMLVLLMLMFYVVLAKTGLPTEVVAIIAFGMNCAAYISEIYRTGIQSIDNGQKEAGLALGFSPTQTFFYFIAPQAIHKALPVFKNESVSLLKGTAIVGYISIIDLTKASDLIRSASFEAFLPLLVISVIYFFLAWLFTTAIDIIVKRI